MFMLCNCMCSVEVTITSLFKVIKKSHAIIIVE